MPKYNPFLIVRVRLDGLAGFEVVLSRCIFGEKSDSDRFRTKSSPKVTFKGSFDGDDGPPGGGGELRPSSCCSSLWIPSPWMTASFTRRRSAKLNIKLWQLWFCAIVILHNCDFAPTFVHVLHDQDFAIPQPNWSYTLEIRKVLVISMEMPFHLVTL